MRAVLARIPIQSCEKGTFGGEYVVSAKPYNDDYGFSLMLGAGEDAFNAGQYIADAINEKTDRENPFSSIAMEQN